MLIQSLINVFIKKNLSPGDKREQYGRLSSTVGIIVNVFLAALKMVIGLVSTSVSIFGDGVNNLFDSGTAIISLISFNVASRPPDDEHPYGHARFEYISSALVSIIIVVVGLGVFRESIIKIIEPENLEVSIIALILLVISILVKMWLYFFYKKIALAIDSKLVMANAADSVSDVIASSAIVVAVVIGKFFPVNLDGPMGILVSFIIMKTGFEILKQVADQIIGVPPSEEQIALLEAEFNSYDGVLGLHDLILHDYGPGRQFLTVHLEMDADKTLLESHRKIDRIEKQLLEKHGIKATIHIDPIISDENYRQQVEDNVIDLVGEKFPTCEVQDVRLVDSFEKRSVVFNVLVPRAEQLSDTELVKGINKLFIKRFPYHNVDVVVIRE